MSKNYFFLTDKEKSYLRKIIVLWIEKRCEIIKNEKKDDLIPTVEDQFKAYKILIDDNFLSALKSNLNSTNYFIDHTGFNCRVKVKNFENEELSR